MRTDELVRLLAMNVEPINPMRSLGRFAGAVSLGLLAALGITGYLLHLNPRLGWEMYQTAFWVRELYCAAFAGIGTLALGRLGRPGSRLGLLPMSIIVVILGMWALGAVVLAAAPPSTRGHLILGDSFKVCSVLIALVAAPLFITALWIMKGLAPTRLRWSGAGAGFVAGAFGALIYSLHCPELAPPFIGIWYLLGILIPTGIGAALGPRVLRW
jgi:hypothetical protein